MNDAVIYILDRVNDVNQRSLDTRLPKLHVGGQGQYLRSLDHLGWSSEVKEMNS